MTIHSFSFFMVAVNILINSTQSVFNEEYCLPSKYFVSYKRSNQYSVSSASFNAIFNLLKKSIRD